MNCPNCQNELEANENKSLIEENSKLTFSIDLDCPNCEWDNEYTVNLGQNT